MVRSRRSYSKIRNSTTGTLDTRFTGPTLDPLSKILSEYDPQGAAISSAYPVGVQCLCTQERWHYDGSLVYKPGIDVYRELGLQASAAWARISR